MNYRGALRGHRRRDELSVDQAVRGAMGYLMPTPGSGVAEALVARRRAVLHYSDPAQEVARRDQALADVGYIAAGSITRRHTRCSNPNCRCHSDPLQMHGHYWQWTAKINGKTVTRRLGETEARLYQEWIANDRQLRANITQMREIAARATELIT